MLKKRKSKVKINNKLMSLALATGITTQAIPLTNALPSMAQKITAYADNNTKTQQPLVFTIQTKDENNKIIASDKITYTPNGDGTYNVTDEQNILKSNLANFKPSDSNNFNLNDVIDSTKELNWLSQNGKYKLASNNETGKLEDNNTLTFNVITNSENNSNTEAKQTITYHLNLVNDGKIVKTDTITFIPNDDGSYTVKDEAGLAITTSYTPTKNTDGSLNFNLNNALNSNLSTWINDGTWQLDSNQTIEATENDINYKVIKTTDHQNNTSQTQNIVLNLINTKTGKIVKSDTFTFTPTGKEGEYSVTDTAGLAPAITYQAPQKDGVYQLDLNAVISGNTLGNWINDGTWQLDGNNQQATQGKDGSLNFNVVPAKNDTGYLQAFKDKYPSNEYGIINQNGSTFTFVQFDPQTKEVTYMGSIDMSQENPTATKLNDGTTSYERHFVRHIDGDFDGEKHAITSQTAIITVTQHSTFVGDNQPLKTNLTYSKAQFDAINEAPNIGGFKAIGEVNIPAMEVTINTPSDTTAEQVIKYESLTSPDSGQSSSASSSSASNSSQSSSAPSSATSDRNQNSSTSSSATSDSNQKSSTSSSATSDSSQSSSTPSSSASNSDQSSNAPSSSASNSDQSPSASSSAPSNSDQASSAPSSATSDSGQSSSTSSSSTPNSDQSSSTPNSSTSNNDQSSSAPSSATSKSGQSSSAPSSATAKTNNNKVQSTLPIEATSKFNNMPVTTTTNSAINPQNLAQTNNPNNELNLSLLGSALIIGGLGMGLVKKHD